MSVFLKDKFRASGMTINELAEAVGVSYVTAWKWVQQGVTPNPDRLERLFEMGFSSVKEAPWQSRSRESGSDGGVTFLLHKFHASGMTTQELAKKLHIAHSTVWRWVNKGAVPHKYLLSKLLDMGLVETSIDPDDIFPERKALRAEVARITQERDEARAEVERLRDLLGRSVDLRDFPYGGVISAERDDT